MNRIVTQAKRSGGRLDGNTLISLLDRLPSRINNEAEMNMIADDYEEELALIDYDMRESRRSYPDYRRSCYPRWRDDDLQTVLVKALLEKQDNSENLELRDKIHELETELVKERSDNELALLRQRMESMEEKIDRGRSKEDCL
ncbi:hypothetical protein AKJ43_02965 [candidate division MSBL1 archaeon SCGC-AAA261D19]|uniref:Uncharacterized protein n=1 Tax=candidate division MSBL1 archaeon SCGC-AAA261D19 TaxID=1698273 RepID=A0A133V623_9EURY|nr:hypothetical protein AKJ43_02965 [candidate division MSBL1 archaeon SCGC-AAA261D19]